MQYKVATFGYAPDGRVLERGMEFSEQVEWREGYLWPKADNGEFAATKSELPSVLRLSELARQRRVVVQAGGNCGMFPKAYSDLFETVYTFEPDPLNFFCLVQNACARNVVKAQVGLGFERQLLSVFGLYPDNMAGYGVRPGGTIPTMRIDDLALEVCDLIQVDIEGSELQALKGAASTIERCRPVIAAEIKVLPNNFGSPGDAIRAYVTSFGYRSIGWCFMDEIFAPLDF